MFNLDLFANYENTETAFEDINQNFNLVKYIHNIQNDPKQMQAVLAGSYIHDNGFYKITLADNGINKLRLHIWNNSERSFMENIHNHRWNLYSRILIGGYRNEIYKRVQSGTLYYEYCYQPSNEGQVYQLSYVGRSFLELTDITEKLPGNNVFLGHQEIHRVAPLTNYTASLFLSGSPHKNNTEVFSMSKYDQINVTYQYFKMPELERIFSDFLNRLPND